MPQPSTVTDKLICERHFRHETPESAHAQYIRTLRNAARMGTSHLYKGLDVYKCTVWETGKHWHLGRKPKEKHVARHTA